MKSKLLCIVGFASATLFYLTASREDPLSHIKQMKQEAIATCGEQVELFTSHCTKVFPLEKCQMDYARHLKTLCTECSPYLPYTADQLTDVYHRCDLLFTDYYDDPYANRVILVHDLSRCYQRYLNQGCDQRQATVQGSGPVGECVRAVLALGGRCQSQYD